MADESYQLALDILNKRYGQKPLIIERLNQRLMKLSLNNMQANELRRFLDELNKILAQLKTATGDINQNGTICSVIVSKLPSHVFMKLEEMKGSYDPWTVELLCDKFSLFVSQRESVADHAESKRSENERTGSERYGRQKPGQTFNRNNENVMPKREENITGMSAVNTANSQKAECQRKKVMLLTAIAEIRNPNNVDGSSAMARIFLDSGNERSYITASMARKLGLKTQFEESLKVNLFLNKTQRIDSSVVNLKIHLKDGSKFPFEANVVDEVSGPITRFELSPEDQQIIRKEHAYLADSSWEEPAFVPDILIGGDYFWDFVKGEKEVLPSGLQLIPSAFGLLIGGLDKSDSNVRSEIQDKTAPTKQAQLHGWRIAERESWEDSKSREVNRDNRKSSVGSCKPIIKPINHSCPLETLCPVLEQKEIQESPKSGKEEEILMDGQKSTTTIKCRKKIEDLSTDKALRGFVSARRECPGLSRRKNKNDKLPG